MSRLELRNIKATDLQVIFDVLKNNSTLSELRLIDNAFGISEMELMSEFLKNNTTLKNLCLENDKIDTVGAIKLLEGLRKNTTLKLLVLNNNSIDFSRAQSIVEALSNNEFVELKLEGNSMENDDLKTIYRDVNANNLYRAICMNTEEMRGISREAKDWNQFLDFFCVLYRGMYCSVFSKVRQIAVDAKNDDAVYVVDHLRLMKYAVDSGQDYALGLVDVSYYSDVLEDELVDVLKDNVAIRYLWFDGCIGRFGNRIAQSLKMNTSLKTIKIVDFRRVSDAVIDAFMNHPALTSLTLDGVDDETAKRIGEHLKNNSTLIELNFTEIENEIIEHCDFEWFGPEGLKDIFEGLRDNSTLTRLEIGGTCVGADEAKLIGEFLKENSTLVELKLAYADITDEGLGYILEGLRENSVLTCLDLSENELENKETNNVLKLLNANETLTSLNLSSNKIGDEGARALLKKLKDNSTLTSLDLSSNQIGDEGARALLKGLKDNSTLTELDLRYNPISDEVKREMGIEINI